MASADMKRYFGPEGLLAREIQGFEYRSAQLEMAQAVCDCLAEEKPLLVEAGTGTGKTWAYLIAAVASGLKVMISTGTKTLQDQLLDHDVPLLKMRLFPNLKVVCLKGRKNYLCRRRFKEFAYQPTLWNREETRLFKKLQEWALHTRTGDRAEAGWLPDRFHTWDEVSANREQCLGQECEEHGRCFLMRARAEAAQAHVVIVNHHLFVSDMAVRRAGYGEVLPEYEAVVFDEAHQLEDVIGLHFGLRFNVRSLGDLRRDLLREIRKDGGKTAALRDLETTLQQLEVMERLLPSQLRNSAGQQSRFKLDMEKAGESFSASCSAVIEALKHIAAVVSGLKEDGPQLESAHRWSLELARCLQSIMDQKDTSMVYWVELTANGATLYGTPVEVSGLVRENLFDRIRAVVLTSATLSVGGSFDYLREALGVPDDRRELLLESPFSYEKQGLLYIPSDFPLPSDPSFCSVLAEHSLQILQKTRGRALFLFTSYRNLHECHQRMRDRLPYPILVQGQKANRALLAEFKEKVGSVLLATNSFRQGIDIPGEALSCLLIDKLPFEVPDDPVTAARMEWAAAGGGSAFYRYQVPRAVIQLKQAVGRLIRSSQDRGVVAIFDMRLHTKSYGRLFLESLPPFRLIDSTEALDRFLV